MYTLLGLAGGEVEAALGESPGTMGDEEEDLPDQKIAIVEACRTGECAKKWGLYTSCVSRVEDPSNPRGISKDPEANCTSWYLDFWKCADKCGANQLFKELK